MNSYVSIDDLSERQPITVLAPHPDDESLGCGALLAAAFEGQGARVVCMTDGSRSHLDSMQWNAVDLARLRAKELLAAVEQLGGSESDVTFLDMPDGELPHAGVLFDAICERITEDCLSRGSRALFASDGRDHHADHQATAAIAVGVLARAPSLQLFHYSVWLRWDEPERHAASPEILRFDPTTWRTRKLRSINEHRSQRGLVVDDDPTGFVLSQAMIDRFVREDEFFTRVVP